MKSSGRTPMMIAPGGCRHLHLNVAERPVDVVSSVFPQAGGIAVDQECGVGFEVPDQHL